MHGSKGTLKPCVTMQAEKTTRLIFIKGCTPSDRFDGMPNFNRGPFKSPLSFFLKPAGPGAQHAARVKVNANYQSNFDTKDNFSIGFFSTTGIAPNHNVGSVRQNDVDGMIGWLDANRNTFIEYYNGIILFAEFEARLTANPYP
jgi:hypothetical protein